MYALFDTEIESLIFDLYGLPVIGTDRLNGFIVLDPNLSKLSIDDARNGTSLFQPHRHSIQRLHEALQMTPSTLTVEILLWFHEKKAPLRTAYGQAGCRCEDVDQLNICTKQSTQRLRAQAQLIQCETKNLTIENGETEVRMQAFSSSHHGN
ncbi:hypothetical protein TNCV_1811781 [Trichonephila clavipes]|nr:hypothetical protein TNCV_1811781 [Trichonephila clavipes]